MKKWTRVNDEERKGIAVLLYGQIFEAMEPRLIAWRNMKLFAKPTLTITSLSVKGLTVVGHEHYSDAYSGR